MKFQFTLTSEEIELTLTALETAHDHSRVQAYNAGEAKADAKANTWNKMARDFNELRGAIARERDNQIGKV